METVRVPSMCTVEPVAMAVPAAFTAFEWHLMQSVAAETCLTFPWLLPVP